ncbi:MAG: PxKF domain-containing protein, partial [Gaiellaceae bacterium]
IASGSIAAGSIAAGSIGLGVAASGSIAAGSIPSGGQALKSVLLSQIPLVGTTWADILKNTPFANQPTQAVTLYDVANYSVRDTSLGGDNKTPWERLMALPLRQVPFFTTLWRNIPFGTLLLGNAPLDTLPPPKMADGTRYASWVAAIADNGGSTTGLNTATNTAFGVAVAGQLGTTNVGSIAAGSIASGSIASGSIAAGSIAAGSIAAGSIDLRATSLGAVPLTQVTGLSDIVNCAPAGSFDCTGKTLGDASAAHAIKDGVTLADLLNHLSPPHDTITIDEIAQAMLQVADYPWEQINVQGLQDVFGTGKNVHYHVDFDLVCSLATSFSVHVKLPSGFFPVAGSSAFSYAGGSPLAASDPTSGANGPVWSNLPGSPCGGGTATRHVRLDFTSYAGLTIGTQTSDVDVTANGTYAALKQAPVLVTQNWEPSDDPGTAPTIDKNTLVVGHIATNNDVDFYRFPLDNLPPGTKITAYLKVPHDGTDLDLAINKPPAPNAQPSASGSIAAGSIAAGSIPIEDTSPGVDNSHGALQPDAAADLASGSIASGSIASGSIASGSISANRGAVNEAAQIVTRGETGAAVIQVSGYLGATSDQNYVLRIKVTPPPTLPACDPMTGLDTATPGTLPAVPASPDPSVKALFLVNRQRLVGLYGQARTDALLGVSSPLNAVAGLAGGQVLQVDGDPAVRTAYSVWDQNPCSIDASNNVVRSINNLVSTYRPKYPNLKYVVLLGTHQAVPMWAQQDLTSDSPEIDEASDLAFSTHGLTKGNAIYAVAAQNAVLTDGAYGAFTHRNWLGHDIPLPDVSVSRLVETPEDINGQLQQFVDLQGHLSPHTALTTGDSFFADGAQAASDALGQQLPGLTQQTLLPPTLWTHQNLLDDFFNKSPVPDVGALWAHYSHWTAQPAGIPAIPTIADFATTADVTPSPGTLLFTVGCHSGLNVPDLIMRPDTPANFGADNKRFLDWAQAYLQAKTAVYVANTGFGYGDTTTVDLSERLMDHFAHNINSGGTIGEEWVRALHQYYSEPSNYDVIDEKVMVEATMYGLPFYDFGSITPQNVPSPPTPPSHAVENGVDTAHLPEIAANIQQQVLGDGRSLFVNQGHPDGTTFTDGNGVPLTMGTLSVFYRPAQPEVMRDVTVPGSTAHGAWIRSLTTHTFANVNPVKPFPLVHSADDAPVRDYPNIFFPAGVVTVNRDIVFGKEQDTAVVNLGKFFPNDTGNLGTEQVVDAIGLDVGYSSSADNNPPQIKQVGAVKTAPGTFQAFVRVTDESGLNRVAVLYNTGSATWGVQSLSNAGGDLWTGTINAPVDTIRFDAEAQDTAGNVGYSFNKAVNFQSTVDTTKPSTLINPPLPNSVYTLNQQARAQFDCSDAGAVASCTGSSDGGPAIASGGLLNTSTPGQHTFTVTAVDLSGNTTQTSVRYVVRFVFSGFRPPVDSPPVLNVAKAGSTVPVKWGLTDAAGAAYINLNAVQSVSSKAIRCPTAATDPVSVDVPVGLSGLKVNGTDLHFNWSTDKGWAGTCRRLFIHFSDLTTPYADFQFK